MGNDFLIQSPEQLPLPFEDFVLGASTRGLPPEKRLYCNRDLTMSQITWIGFDMDYTLAIYDQPEMDRLSIEATVAKLVLRGYPTIIAEIPKALDFPVRGLLIDKRFGHILKMDRHKHVHKGYHGFRELSKDELRKLYHEKKIRPATSRYHWIDTLYALSEASLYAAMVHEMELRGLAVDYSRVFTDIRECIDEAHRDGTILDTIASDLPRFVRRDPKLAPTIHKLRSAGKKLFLLTNSQADYTAKMMTYLLGGAMPEYPSWENYFDVVISAACKPAFFQEKRPLLEHKQNELVRAQTPLERGKMYQGGNLVDVERALGVTGDQILYVGDHIYGDILRSKKESAWRTAMIMQELEQEVRAHASCREDFARAFELDELRDHLEDELRDFQTQFKELTRRLDGDATNGRISDLEAERERVKRALDRVRARLRQVTLETTSIDRRIDERFHPFWGSLLKQGNEPSSFGAQVDAYACLYTSRVSNFFYYSPQQHFRSARNVMPHELD